MFDYSTLLVCALCVLLLPARALASDLAAPFNYVTEVRVRTARAKSTANMLAIFSIATMLVAIRSMRFLWTRRSYRCSTHTTPVASCSLQKVYSVIFYFEARRDLP